MNKLNFGCGSKIFEGWTNVDIVNLKGVDKAFDFDIFPYPLKENTFDYVLIDGVLEHCIYPRKVLEELRRVCKNDAIIKINVPYVNSRSAYYDLEHCHFFNRWTFTNLDKVHLRDTEENPERRFEVIKNEARPQRFLKWIPRPILNLLAVPFNSIFVDIDAEIKVIKTQ